MDAFEGFKASVAATNPIEVLFYNPQVRDLRGEASATVAFRVYGFKGRTRPERTIEACFLTITMLEGLKAQGARVDYTEVLDLLDLLGVPLPPSLPA